MATPVSPLILTALGGLAVGAVAGWQLNSPSPSDDESPAVEASLQLGERQRGEITSQSELNGKDGSRFTRYVLPLEEDTLVEVALGGALQGVLALYDDEEQLIAAATTLRHRIDESRDYTLVVSGNDAHSYGPFDITSRRIELDDVSSLEVPSRHDGWLQDAPDTYTLTIEETGLYQIEMRSSDLDAYLELEGPNGYRREDDDGAGDLDARLADFLEPGEYRLTARTSYGEGSGLYTLAVEPRELPNADTLRNGGELSPDESLHGWFSGQGLEYELVLESAATVTLDMRSSDFDAFLELHGDGVSVSDDDGGGGTDARLYQHLAPGRYTITARSYSQGGSGLFELEASVRDADAQPNGGELELDEPISAWLAPGVRDTYTFRVAQAGRYRIDMMSSEMDAYLELEGAGTSLTDDDGGEGLDARIQAYLEPGDYRAIARTYGNSEGGNYRLRVSAE
ncbi:hypothetical protein [Halomonas heilongjiangensis]|uniref:ABC transporter substrate-binding protein n=1 Tax=Halomonas heilongjiangensis TaxID=1387883 RepID=A0A2N7TVH6_9GAMM|nr:hypothetical protein [Halomonas heilongjiangensis]PMR72186.1 hypothetical protein C1H66_00650 [Halomonas heilongjiangensis]PXX91437.1 hypothetical protein CR158_08010 [Halomonas heilongjiangensis]